MQILDVSDTIFYHEQKSQNDLLSLTNATVSHELRNPLNSLIAINILKKNLYKELAQEIKKLPGNLKPVLDIVESLNENLVI